MRIMGIDPGLANVGYVILETYNEDDGVDFRLDGCGVITTSNKDGDAVRRLEMIAECIMITVDAANVKHIFIEEPINHSNPQTRWVCSSFGAIIGALTEVYSSESIHMVHNMTWKAFTNVKKKEEALRAIYGFTGTKVQSQHEADAGCVAICGYSNLIKKLV